MKGRSFWVCVQLTDGVDLYEFDCHQWALDFANFNLSLGHRSIIKAVR